jgi:transcriptional regulator with XRE-family HTH domain
LSQEQLAEKAGLHSTYIGQLERGEKNATLESVEKVARALDLPFEVLFEKIIVGSTSSDTASKCYDVINSQPQEGQSAILDLIKRVIEFINI